MSDLSQYVTFKDLNAELSRYQRRFSCKALLAELDTLSRGERLAMAIVLIGAAKTLLLRVIL